MVLLDTVKKFFLKKKEREEGNMSDTPSNASAAPQPKKRKHKLEIQVYEADYEKMDANNGKPQWRPVNYGMDNGKPLVIEVADKKEFAEICQQYAMCDQQVRVVREIDPFDDEPDAKPAVPAIPQNNQAVPVTAPAIQQVAASIPDQAPVLAQPQQSIVKQTAVKAKPKIVMVGDVEVKYDGDKVYQKQWMKLTPTEASNFRLVNDSNNKIVNMSGKHLEAKRWVLLEETQEVQDNDSVETILKD